MSEKYQILFVGDRTRYMEDLVTLCRETGQVTHAYFADTPDRGIKKLNGHNQINLVIVALGLGHAEVDLFLRQASETLYGGFSCFIGAFELTDQHSSALPDSLHGFISVPANGGSVSELMELVRDTRAKLGERSVERWLRGVLEKLITQLDVIVELKRAGYASSDHEGQLRTLARRLNTLNPQHFALWERLLLEMLADKAGPAPSLAHLHYRGASSRIQNRYESKIVNAVKDRHRPAGEKKR